MSQVIKTNAADVRFEGVSKIYGKDAVAVGDIDLTVEKAGTLVTLLELHQAAERRQPSG